MECSPTAYKPNQPQKMKKKLIITLIIIGTILTTYGLIKYIGMKGFAFAWTLNLMLMMCVFVFTETLKAKFTSSYYEEKKWEKNGKIYESIGIHFFRKLLVVIGWEKLNKKDNPVKNSYQALAYLEYRTKQSELGHLIIFFIVLGFNIFVIFKFGFVESLWLTVLNILLNVYPIFLQRYNRPRLIRAIKLSKIKEERFMSK